MDNVLIFEQICDLAVELEQTAPLPPRVRRRLANAFSRAIEKAFAINFCYEIPDDAYMQSSIFRHAERGVRDFVP